MGKDGSFFTLRRPRESAGRPPRARPHGRRGEFLVEVAIAFPVVLMALGMLVQMLYAGSGLRELGTEEWASSSAAQDVLERMRNQDFRDLFRLYNADPFDDPGGAGTAPGNAFSVRGLAPLRDDADGQVGEVLLPFRNTGTQVVPV